MKQTEQLSLIQGTFSVEEAEEILMNIFSSKIQFHEMKKFSAIERFGISKDSTSERIESLKSEKEKLRALIQNAKKHHLLLNVSAVVNLQSVQ